MGVLSYLVSDSTEEYFEFGKILWGSETTKAIRSGRNLERVIADAIVDPDYNTHTDKAWAQEAAKKAAEWIVAHPDWRAIADCDEDYDDVYLAESEADAREYREEFPESEETIYMKTGSVWDEDGEDED